MRGSRALVYEAQRERDEICFWLVSFVGLIWFLAFLSFQIFGFLHPDLRNDVQPIVERIFDIGAGLASFISPILQLALVLLIISNRHEPSTWASRD